MKKTLGTLCLVLNLLAGIPLYGGMLEDLEADVKYLYTEYEAVKRVKRTSPFYTEYLQRMRMAQSRAYKIQQTANSLGIKNMDVQSNLANMLSFCTLTKSNMNKKNKGSRWYYYGEVNKQIRKLKELKFSYEQRMYTRLQNSGRGEVSALKEFERQFKNGSKFAEGKKIFSESMMKTFYETKIEPFLKLGKDIVREQIKQKPNMPDDYNLYEHLTEFDKAYKRISAEMKKQNSAYYSDLRNGKHHESYRKPNAVGRTRNMKETAEYRKARELLDLTIRRIGRDIELLNEAGVDFQIGTEDSVTPMRTGQDSAFQQWEQNVSEQNGDLGNSPQAILKKYKKILKQCYFSESRINGVSDEYFLRYRSKLPPRMVKLLDQEYKKQLNNHYPEKMAKKSAVLTVHSRCISADLNFFTKAELSFMETVKED